MFAIYSQILFLSRFIKVFVRIAAVSVNIISDNTYSFRVVFRHYRRAAVAPDLIMIFPLSRATAFPESCVWKIGVSRRCYMALPPPEAGRALIHLPLADRIPKNLGVENPDRYPDTTALKVQKPFCRNGLHGADATALNRCTCICWSGTCPPILMGSVRSRGMPACPARPPRVIHHAVPDGPAAGPRRLPRLALCVNVRAALGSIIGFGFIGARGTIAIEELSPKIPALNFDRIKVQVRNVDVVRARAPGRTFTGIRLAGRMGDLVTAPVHQRKSRIPAPHGSEFG